MDCFLTTSIFAIAIAIVTTLWHWIRRRWWQWRWPKRLSPSLYSPPQAKSTNSKLSALSAKIDFLERFGSSYGYVNSRKGFIDDWRLSEFPSLIPPLKLEPHFHKQKIILREKEGHGDGENVGTKGNDPSAFESEVYLDYAGSAIPSRTLLSRISRQDQILANPHSQGGGLASDRTLKLMQLSKDEVMQHFGINHETFGIDVLDNGHIGVKKHASCPGYQLVFTSGATESLRLIAERFPWSSAKITAAQKSHIALSNVNRSSRQLSNTQASMHISKQIKSIQVRSLLLYPRNVHTSVIGMRHVAIQRGARFQCVSVDELLSATSEWFQTLIRGSMSFEYLEEKTCEIKEAEEKKDEYGVHPISRFRARLENTSDEKTPRETIWVHHLLVLPLECNFGGDRFDWTNTTKMARQCCFSSYLDCHGSHSEQSTSIPIRICHKWHILLDTAKAASTCAVDLPNLTHGGGPDLAVVSFYKMFGAPTGLGALFIKKNQRKKRSGNKNVETRTRTSRSEAAEAATKITQGIPKHNISDGMTVVKSLSPRHFFGGGSVDVVLPDEDFVVPRNSNITASSARQGSGVDENIDFGLMVHGTEHFRGIASLVYGFQELDGLGGMKAISSHSTCLAVEFVRRLGALMHCNGKPVVQLYGQWKSYQDKLPGIDNSNAIRCFPGPTVAFNIFDYDGSLIGYDEASRLASLNFPPIQLRTGCFCNPGACQDAIPLTDAEILNNYTSGHVCGDPRGILNGKPTGAIRVSFGKDSIWEDMDVLARFIEKVFVSRGEASIPSQGTNEHKNSADDPDIIMKIDSLFLYPIKSCAAMTVNSWPIDRRSGRFAFDREFALVDTSGSAMRLHAYPQMSSIHPVIDLSTNRLTVSAPNSEDLVVSLGNSDNTTENLLSHEDIQVCGALCKGSIWGGSKASEWFSSVLGVRCWLARHLSADKTENVVSDDNRQYAYCNEASVLLVSQQSISFLNSVINTRGMGKLVESRHFRPNIVVSRSSCEGGGDHVIDRQMEGNQKVSNPEDSWQKITITGSTDEIDLNAVGKCARCQMVDVDPSSGMKGNTLRALAQYRRDRGKVNFGTFFTGNKSIPEGKVLLEKGSEVRATSIILEGNS